MTKFIVFTVMAIGFLAHDSIRAEQLSASDVKQILDKAQKEYLSELEYDKQYTSYKKYAAIRIGASLCAYAQGDPDHLQKCLSTISKFDNSSLSKLNEICKVGPDTKDLRESCDKEANELTKKFDAIDAKVKNQPATNEAAYKNAFKEQVIMLNEFLTGPVPAGAPKGNVLNVKTTF